MDYQKVFLPSYWTKKLQFLSLITEKKVEIFHSLLRENTREHNDAKSLSEIAKVIASSGFVSFQGGFHSPLSKRDFRKQLVATDREKSRIFTQPIQENIK